MKKILKIILIAISFIIINTNTVKADTLTKSEHDDIWIFRKGGGIPSFSGKFTDYEINGLTTYCIEPGTHITTTSYTNSGGIEASPFSDEINTKLELIGYYGYDYPTHHTTRYRMATQALIWETVSPQKVEFWTEKSGGGTYISVDAEKEEILRMVNEHNIVPSFTGEVRQVTLYDYTTFTDTNNVLDNFKVANISGLDYTFNGNNLTIAPLKEGDTIVTLIKKKYSNKHTIIYTGNDNESQLMAYFSLSSDVLANFVLKTIGGYVTITKNDIDNNSTTPKGDAKLYEAIYGIYYKDNNNLVEEITINEDGVGISNNLRFADYYIKEISPGLGYTLDPTKYYFKVTKDNMYPNINVYEKVIEHNLEVYKVLNNDVTGVLTPEEDVTFNIYLKSNMELISTKVTDEDGYFYETLPYGTYIIRQMNSKVGYEIAKDIEIKIDKEDVKKVISDTVLKAKVKVIKKDYETGSVIKEEVLFKIKNLKTNKYICQNITYPNQEKICEFKTMDGYFVTPEYLDMGTYELEEVENQIIKGYIWNKEKVKFTISPESNFTIDNEYGTILEVEFKNTSVKGILEIYKTDEEGSKLDGVEYNLYANNTIYNNNYEVKYHEGELIKKIVIKDGYYKLDNLSIGKYYLEEVKTNDSYVLNSDKIYFEIINKDQYNEYVNIKLELVNYKKRGKFILNKIDGITNLPIEGVLIGIYTIDDVLIDKVYTNSLGIIEIDNLLVGKYKYKEEESKEGYVLDNNYYYFEIKENNEIVTDTLYNTIISVPNTYSNNNNYLYSMLIIILSSVYLIYESFKKI